MEAFPVEPLGKPARVRRATALLYCAAASFQSAAGNPFELAYYIAPGSHFNSGRKHRENISTALLIS
jgi:hypothetical protein